MSGDSYRSVQASRVDAAAGRAAVMVDNLDEPRTTGQRLGNDPLQPERCGGLQRGERGRGMKA